ncbi:hypothetical protein CcaverHIS002_0510570 [Cutaneotrichosporon cavernicola]|nr:hypothetical protein CcaverHIS002_0510570 [Cutaneotrichosporon cavernicola]BEJ01263.1 hypothetical protein CcaverHIS631_0511200 [Cutaneotrichosporon cavernicola]BEJ09031.1 hypothetical protein CcaverHIS641_0511250 [Cutaneotrichosporon cavernicola]
MANSNSNDLDPYQQDASATQLYNEATNVEDSEGSWETEAVESGQAADAVWAGAPHGATIVKRLGSGGFGSTFQVEWQNQQKALALKVCVNDENCRVGWANEVAVLRRLHQVPGVAQLHWAGYSPKHLFLLLDLGEMGNLSAYMAAGGVGLGETLRVSRELCTILAEVHRRDVLHLDLKTANIVLTSDEQGMVHPVIIDWGLSMFLEDGHCVHRPDSTAGYMAPEQRDWKKDVTAAVDIWTVLLMIVELMEGECISEVAWNAELEYDHEALNAVDDAENLPVLGPVRGWFKNEAWNSNIGASCESWTVGTVDV